MKRNFPRKLSEMEMIEQPLWNSLETDKSFLEAVLRRHEDDPGLEVAEVSAETEPPCGEVDNYLSSATRLHVLGTRKSGEWFSSYVLVKRQPPNPSSAQGLRWDPAFRNEVCAYTTVIPLVNSLLKTPTGGRSPFASCLYATPHLIVLEDLQQYGFKMVDRLEGLDYNHSAAALKALGHFHAASLALKHRDPKSFRASRSQIKEQAFHSGASTTHGMSMENALRMALVGLQCLEENCEILSLYEAAHKLQTLHGTVFHRMAALVRPREPSAVVCHGDFWTNNIMFKYGKDGAPEEAAFIDLQVARYAPPSTDLLHFLYTSTSPGLTKYYHDELVGEYQKALETKLGELEPAAEAPTLAEVMEDLEEHALYGLLITFLILPAVTAAEEETAAEIKKAILKKGSYKSNENAKKASSKLSRKYYERLKNLVLEFVDRGYI